MHQLIETARLLAYGYSIKPTSHPLLTDVDRAKVWVREDRALSQRPQPDEVLQVRPLAHPARVLRGAGGHARGHQLPDGPPKALGEERLLVPLPDGAIVVAAVARRHHDLDVGVVVVPRQDHDAATVH